MAGLIMSPGIPAMPIPKQKDSLLTLVGLGGAGGRIVSKFADGENDWNEDLDVRYFAIDTDHRSLDYVSDVVHRILLPDSIPPESLGSCIHPRYGRQAGWTHRSRIERIFLSDRTSPYDQSILIFLAGFGGGAGTGLTQTLMWQARQHHPYYSWPTLAMPLSTTLRTTSRRAEMRRIRKASDCSYCLYCPDESDPMRSWEKTHRMVDQAIIDDIRGSLSRC